MDIASYMRSNATGAAKKNIVHSYANWGGGGGGELGLVETEWERGGGGIIYCKGAISGASTELQGGH